MPQECRFLCFHTSLAAFLMTLTLSNGYAPDVERQADMTTCELVQDFGYSCETFEATTSDGYVLEIDRVRTLAQRNATNTTQLQPVLLVPGIFCESGAWFVNFPEQSPGFLLADRGYDVWAMNPRDIIFRAHHLELSQEDDRYWQFSFDEIGRLDVAAAIDLVRNATKAAKVALLGYSQGFTASLILLSTRPEYNDKVDVLMGYAPVANLTHIGFPFPLLIAISDILFLLVDPFGNSGYLYLPDPPREFLESFCNVFQGMPCSLLYILPLLSSPQQFNKTRSPVILSHAPIGTSFQNLRHFVQIYRAKNFVMYDHGLIQNKNIYGQVTPPSYALERVAVPVQLFWSEGDSVASSEDAADLMKRLGSNLVYQQKMPQKNFRHFDFITGSQAANFLHKPMIDGLDSRARQ